MCGSFAMQVSVLRRNGLKLSQGAAIVLLAGMTAGCSSQVARFGSVDDFMTASTPNQREIIRPSAGTSGAQTYPDEAQQTAVAVGGTYSEPVTRGTLAPVSEAPAASAPAPQPVRTASAPPNSSSGEPKPGDPPQQSNQNLAVLPQTPKGRDKSTSGTALAGDTNAVPSSAAGTYKVQDGDTLSRISRNTGASVTAIKEANGLSDGLIRVGQTLRIPGSAGATKVASAAPKTDPIVTPAPKTAEAPAAKPAGEGEKVASYTPPKKTEKVIEQADETAPDATGIGRMRWPVRGRVISQYGKGTGKSNDGIDISVPEGTPVKAAENGVVIYAGDGLKEFGNTVLVRHEDGLVTVYGHASELKVTRGDKVRRGQEIALSGMSGTTDAPKLHFEVRKNSAPVDPSTYLE